MLRDLEPFAKFKKREKHPWRGVTFRKVASFKPATLLKVIILHGCFLRFFFNCTNDTKSRKTSQIEKAFELDNIQRHPNDQDSVLSWIQEWEQIDKNPMVIYKFQGQLNEEVGLEKDDFVAIIQTELTKASYAEI